MIPFYYRGNEQKKIEFFYYQSLASPVFFPLKINSLTKSQTKSFFLFFEEHVLTAPLQKNKV